MGDIVEFKQAYPKINYRHFVMPSRSLGGGMTILNFDNATNTWPAQMLGREDGENSLKLESGFFFDKMQEWSDKDELKMEFPRIGDFMRAVYKEQVLEFSGEQN